MSKATSDRSTNFPLSSASQAPIHVQESILSQEWLLVGAGWEHVKRRHESVGTNKIQALSYALRDSYLISILRAHADEKAELLIVMHNLFRVVNQQVLYGHETPAYLPQTPRQIAQEAAHCYMHLCT